MSVSVSQYRSMQSGVLALQCESKKIEVCQCPDDLRVPIITQWEACERTIKGKGETNLHISKKLAAQIHNTL